MPQLTNSRTDLERVATVRNLMPEAGLFAEKDWLVSPEPFPLSARQIEELEKLGHRLNLFNRACNNLYQLSAQGRRPRWIAEHLDRGKPPELVAVSRERRLRNEIPQVIRPDLVLTENGFTIAELDSVPGGIGLTAWLNRVYVGFGETVLGGADGMLEGFQSIFPEGDILVSQEAATYRPEMEWIATQLDGADIVVHDAETYDPSGGRSVYRFFEHFDLPNIPPAKALLNQTTDGNLRVTPPFKPYMEEKMWFALFWLRPLQEFWRQEIGERHWLKLREVIPYTWIVDPSPLPHHAVIPELEIHDWEELGHFSQKQRDLILKISGFSHLAWGSRGVHLAQDMSQKDWQAALAAALRDFANNPYILQRFHKGRLVRHPFYNRETGRIETMEGRVRLCPYYFIVDGKSRMKGALATICPADKKLLHGMKDAILVPAAEKFEAD